MMKSDPIRTYSVRSKYEKAFSRRIAIKNASNLLRHPSQSLEQTVSRACHGQKSDEKGSWRCQVRGLVREGSGAGRAFESIVADGAFADPRRTSVAEVAECRSLLSATIPVKTGRRRDRPHVDPAAPSSSVVQARRRVRYGTTRHAAVQFDIGQPSRGRPAS